MCVDVGPVAHKLTIRSTSAPYPGWPRGCDWIEAVTELAANDDWHAVQRAVNNLEDHQLRGMV
jgi:hypothetical protein